ncbi:MAG: hypothetical protein LBC97_04620 [Bifidobacteriaceae bacterium]|jgi:DNA-directed RNA polymerase subunit RPC12/RpoP|nr:hypothetical protein [Bifidobacteriaceae bacterium]
MLISDPDGFAEMMIRQRTACLRCGTVFSFQQGADKSREEGFKGTVVTCPGCGSVYKTYFAPGRFELTEDVTAEYRGTTEDRGTPPKKSPWSRWLQAHGWKGSGGDKPTT